MITSREFAARRTEISGRLLVCAFFLAAASATADSRAERVNLFPKLRAGQTITYRIRLRADKTIASKSSVAMPLVPTPMQADILANLRIEILDTQNSGSKAVIHARTMFETLRAGKDATGEDRLLTPEDSIAGDTRKKTIEFTIRPDGQLTDVKGGDALLPEEQQALAEWISLFAMAAAFPEEGVKRGEKWQSEETEKAAAPIAGLTWLRRSNYAEDEPCGSQIIESGEQDPKATPASEMCAVIVTTATLRQKSSRKEATAEDFKLHDLRAMGTARGMNQVVAYISLKTGLLMRATQDANQSMDVIMAKMDGSNRVRYKVDAKSDSEVRMLEDMHSISH